MSEDVIRNLLKKAIDARVNAYCAYSKFRVGAALLTENGTIYTGCNVENVNFDCSVCAERVAIVKAVSEGHRKFAAIAISSDLAETLISPCGSCRQVMIEFGNYDVYLVRPDGAHYKKTTVQELLPDAFTPHTYNHEARENGK